MKLYTKNPRRLTKKRHDELLASLDELGDVSGIVHDLNSDQIIGGNQRSAIFDVNKMQPIITLQLNEPNKQGTIAIGYIEWHGEMFSYRAVRWTPEQCAKGNIKANLEAGVWDYDMLAGWPTQDLIEWGFDQERLATWNADGAALATMLEAENGGAGDADAEPQIDRAAELNEKWQVQRGDLWCIGEHRLYCGDSEQGIDLIRGDYKIDAVITDPPYGINIVKGISAAAIGGAKPFGRVRPPGCRTPTGKVGGPGVVEPRLYRPVANDDKPFDPAWLLDLADTVILFGANHFASRLPDSPAWIVWEKNVPDQSTFSACELAWCNVGNHVRRYEWTWSGMVRAGEREVEMKDRIHPTQKPVGLIEKVIEDYTDESAVIADTYVGSGTTMLAAARTNRICVAGELDEAYCAVILERMATAFPGIEIERIAE